MAIETNIGISLKLEPGVLKVKVSTTTPITRLHDHATMRVTSYSRNWIPKSTNLTSIQHLSSPSLNALKDHLAPFTPPPSDQLQLQFMMLSSFHLLSHKPIIEAQNATVSSEFEATNQHSIFSFRGELREAFSQA